jgi:hypothetical protein
MAIKPAATIAERGTISNGVMANSPVPLSRRPGHGDLCEGDGPGESTLLHGWDDGRAGSRVGDTRSRASGEYSNQP